MRSRCPTSKRSSVARFRSRRSTTARWSAPKPARRTTDLGLMKAGNAAAALRGAGRGTHSVAEAHLNELEDSVYAQEIERRTRRQLRVRAANRKHVSNPVVACGGEDAQAVLDEKSAPRIERIVSFERLPERRTLVRRGEVVRAHAGVERT